MIYKFRSNICDDLYHGETKRHFLVRENVQLNKTIHTKNNVKYTEKMILLLESIVTTIAIQLIYPQLR